MARRKLLEKQTSVLRFSVCLWSLSVGQGVGERAWALCLTLMLCWGLFFYQVLVFVCVRVKWSERNNTRVRRVMRRGQRIDLVKRFGTPTCSRVHVSLRLFTAVTGGEAGGDVWEKQENYKLLRSSLLQNWMYCIEVMFRNSKCTLLKEHLFWNLVFGWISFL